VSIRDIAAEANISVVTIYNHFRNKDGLILEIVKQTVHDQLESFRSVMDSLRGSLSHRSNFFDRFQQAGKV
jgi:AcrR family transcriptional regulator